MPDGNVKELALSVAKKHGSNITPHITVLQSVFSEESLANVIEKLDVWARKNKPFKINFYKKIERGGGGNTFWNVMSVDHLHKINEVLTAQIDPLRDGFLGQIEKNMDSFSELELSNINKYGRHFNVPGSNQPHITVAYGIQDETLMNEVSTELEEKDCAQLISEISIGEIDERGNIVKTLKSFTLQG
ncbi:MAG: 2'-5' RNA ligase family protein [Simkaniaceae bacterium]|nr:2'-5' RNA ligase family protein [Simkaniaceae bacterium]